MKPNSNEPIAVYARKRRSTHKEQGRCINGSAPAVRGVRCLRCYLVHKFYAEAARQMNDYLDAPPCSTSRNRDS